MADGIDWELWALKLATQLDQDGFTKPSFELLRDFWDALPPGEHHFPCPTDQEIAEAPMPLRSE